MYVKGDICMKKEDINYARDLIKSINVALNRIERDSSVENEYLTEKIDKLFRVHHEHFPVYYNSFMEPVIEDCKGVYVFKDGDVDKLWDAIERFTNIKQLQKLSSKIDIILRKSMQEAYGDKQ